MKPRIIWILILSVVFYAIGFALHRSGLLDRVLNRSQAPAGAPTSSACTDPNAAGCSAE